jgi:hypothetical protein
MAYQCVQHNKRIEILVNMEYCQLGKVDKWGVSTVGVYQQFGQIDSLECKQTVVYVYRMYTNFAPPAVVASLPLL